MHKFYLFYFFMIFGVFKVRFYFKNFFVVPPLFKISKYAPVNMPLVVGHIWKLNIVNMYITKFLIFIDKIFLSFN